jgi:DNA-binding transcriptional LysR family regulator
MPVKLDPVSLRLFVAVMEEGTIAAAATRAHLAPAAVSKRISELEGTLDTVLLGLARGLLNNLDDIAEQMAGYASGLRGHVRVFANISAITQFLPDDLRTFMAAAPLVQVHLQERISTSIARAVADSRADIGILNAGAYGESLTLLPYREDELVLIVPREHVLARRRKVTFREALAHDFVGAHPGSAVNNQLHRAAGDLGLPLHLRIQVSGYDAMSLMVAAGLGVGVLPRQSARLYLSSLGIRAVALDEPWVWRQLVVCVRALDALSPAARSLVDHLCAKASVPR